MDLKALMQKLETINTKQIVTESVETKKVITESVARRVVKESADPVFTSSIARGLVEEFGYELEEDTLDEAGLTPEQQAKMGQANPQDPYIVARALGKDAVPVSYFTDPEDQKIAKQLGFKDTVATAPGGAATKPAVAPELVGTQNQAPDAAAQADRIANRMDQEAGANTAGQAAAPAAPAAVDPAVAATREKFKALMDKLEKTGGVSGSAPAPAAPAKPTQIAPAPTGAATKPSTGFANTGGGAAVGNPNMAKQGVKEDPNEGNAFSGALDAAKDSGADEFEVDGNKYPVKETVSYGDDQILTIIKSIKY